MSDKEDLDDLAAIEAAVWRELGRAVGDPAHPWRVAVLATLDGSRVDARSVILRELDADARRLLIYTDARSPKTAQIGQHPDGSLVLWSAALGWQLRLELRLGVETDGLTVSSRWARLKMTPAAQDYLSALPPGARLQAGHLPSPVQRASRNHFAVITADILAIDWLELGPGGHRRAAFGAAGRHWLSP